MNIGAPELIVLLIFGLPIFGIIDAAVKPDSQWRAADQSKVVWLLVQFFLWTIGTLIYLAVIRPKVKAAVRA